MKCACATSSVACPALHYSPTFSHTGRDFRKTEVIEHKLCVLILSATFVGNISYSRFKILFMSLMLLFIFNLIELNSILYIVPLTEVSGQVCNLPLSIYIMLWSEFP